MSFIIKNVRDHDVTVDGVAIGPGKQYTFHTLSADVGNALDRGDLTLTDEGLPGHIDLQPFHSGDKAIDG